MADISKVYQFSGKEEDFEVWKERFAGQMIAAKLGYLVDEDTKEETKKIHKSYDEDN